MDEKQRIVQLRKELHEHNYRYYVLNQPVIGDQDFDFLMHELQELEDISGCYPVFEFHTFSSLRKIGHNGT